MSIFSTSIFSTKVTRILSYELFIEKKSAIGLSYNKRRFSTRLSSDNITNFDLILYIFHLHSLIRLELLLVSSEYISCINLILYIIQTSIVAVSDDGMALCLEGFEVVLYSATKEGAALFQGWLIDDNLSTLCLDTLHDALDG